MTSFSHSLSTGALVSAPRLLSSHGLAFPVAPTPELQRFWQRRSFIERGGEEVHDTLSINQRSVKSARLEAALLVAGGGLSLKKLAQFATLSGAKEVRELIDQLNDSYGRTKSSFRIERVATGYRLLTLPRFANWLDRIHHRQERLKLSSPAMETLSIVAYRQPLTRADIEAVRGVQSSEMLKQLMERSLVKIVGEDDTLGRPYLYGTTRLFLDYFGLQSLEDLPRAATLRRAATEIRAERNATATEGDVTDEVVDDEGTDDIDGTAADANTDADPVADVDSHSDDRDDSDQNDDAEIEWDAA